MRKVGIRSRGSRPPNKQTPLLGAENPTRRGVKSFGGLPCRSPVRSSGCRGLPIARTTPGWGLTAITTGLGASRRGGGRRRPSHAQGRNPLARIPAARKQTPSWEPGNRTRRGVKSVADTNLFASLLPGQCFPSLEPGRACSAHDFAPRGFRSWAPHKGVCLSRDRNSR